MVEVKIKLDEGATMPTQANSSDSGYDLTAISLEWDSANSRLIYHTGVYLDIPKGYEVIILPRSSTSKQEIFMPHSIGLVDQTYNKELLVVYKLVGVNKQDIEWAQIDKTGKLTILLENAKYPYSPLSYRVGDKIAQMVVQKKAEYKLTQVDSIDDSGRGSFGSTDSKLKFPYNTWSDE